MPAAPIFMPPGDGPPLNAAGLAEALAGPAAVSPSARYGVMMTFSASLAAALPNTS